VSRKKLVGFTLFAIACTAAAAFLIVGLRPTAAAQSESAGSAALRTPLWSARRVPAVLARTVESAAQTRANDALTRTLTPIVAPYAACVAVDGPGGSLARVNADTPLTPASTLKLLTATAAIDRLGASYHFTTRVYADSGNLVVIGAGDPLLATPEYIAFRHAYPRYRDAPYTPLANLADAIVAAGVHDVSGAVLVSDSLHDTLRYLPDWKPNYGVDGDVGSLGALSVDGGFSQSNGQTPAPDPALVTGQRLAAMLAARGVTIAGGVRRGDITAPDAREVAHVDSPALSDIVGELLTSSDDYTAEELLRDLANDPHGTTPATTAAGALIVEQQMKKLGVTTAGLVMNDGSGLAPTDRASCSTLLELIEVTSEPRFAAVGKGLAVAAQSGTLANRFVGSPLAGVLHAKTGSLNGVVGLVGRVDGPNNVHFAFLANGNFSTTTGEVLQAEIASAVASAPTIKAPADLVPPP
jgi:D-alanyl-D-alanine carboxypeptidase/D-alanyl-D-alanine-endopeptidase (penicillin-binding protein 4)